MPSPFLRLTMLLNVRELGDSTVPSWVAWASLVEKLTQARERERKSERDRARLRETERERVGESLQGWVAHRRVSRDGGG